MKKIFLVLLVLTMVPAVGVSKGARLAGVQARISDEANNSRWNQVTIYGDKTYKLQGAYSDGKNPASYELYYKSADGEDDLFVRFFEDESEFDPQGSFSAKIEIDKDHVIFIGRNVASEFIRERDGVINVFWRYGRDLEDYGTSIGEKNYRVFSMRNLLEKPGSRMIKDIVNSYRNK